DNGMHRQEPPGVTQSSLLIYWRVSPPVKRETGIQFPDGEAVLNLLYCFGPSLSRRKAKRRAICIGRELNRTLKTRERVRFHRDLNSDRWIQSPECQLPTARPAKCFSFSQSRSEERRVG